MEFKESFIGYIKEMPSVKATGGRPDDDVYGIEAAASVGTNLLVGGHQPPVSDGSWETLDPFCPGDVTYRAKLEDRELADSLADRFSVIMVPAVLEHINPLWYAACVRNLWVMLKPGGIVRVEIPWLWAYHPEDKRYDFGGDFARLSKEGLRRLFEEHPACSWETVLCEYAIPAECPHGVGVCAIFGKGQLNYASDSCY